MVDVRNIFAMKFYSQGNMFSTNDLFHESSLGLAVTCLFQSLFLMIGWWWTVLSSWKCVFVLRPFPHHQLFIQHLFFWWELFLRLKINANTRNNRRTRWNQRDVLSRAVKTHETFCSILFLLVSYHCLTEGLSIGNRINNL